METRKIGRLKVSKVGLGCNNFGSRIDEGETAQVVAAALDQGINFFDTAEIYGGTLSETFLGRALGSRRKDVIIATKFGYESGEVKGGASPENIVRACEGSLRRLGTDVIDLYQLHVPDPEVPIAETLGALDQLVKSGKVREIGCSNFDAAMLREAAETAEGAQFVSVQNEYSLFRREAEEEVLPECERLGIAFLPYFPLASGLLTGKYRMGAPLPESRRIKEGSERLSDSNLELVEKLLAFAESKGHTILELAFSWLLSCPQVASVIAGATSSEQVLANSKAGDWVFTAQDRQELDAILSGQ